MVLGLIGTVIGVNYFGYITTGDTSSSSIRTIEIIIPFTVFVDSVLLFLILQIIKPLEKLTKTSKEIAKGNLSERIKISTHDELGELGVAFNNMAANLQQTKQGLENTVKMKTAELEQNVAELKMQQDKDNAIFKSIGEGLILTDNAGTILFVNKSAEHILGIHHSEKHAKTLMDLLNLYEEDLKPVLKETRPDTIALKKGDTKTSKYILVKKNDQKIVIEMTSSPVIQRNPHGNIDRVIGSITIIRDITKEREVDRMKTEFISLASHQLRTPLSSIKWYTEMLLAGDAVPLTSEQKELAKSVSESSEIMSEIVKALLNISRIELGRLTLTPIPTDLKELISSCVKEVEIKIHEKNQVLTIHIPDDIPKILIDPKFIREVYINLLTNANKYSPVNGEITITIKIENGKIISSVADSGYGIPKYQQDKIFQKFFRADNIVKKETEGSGLGLYLAKAIVESSKGKIWFDSVAEKGTTFYFSLPLINASIKSTVENKTDKNT